MRQGSHSPIGVFDSGVGGLTVLKALMERLPHESTLYLGDTARVPYGTKSGEVVTRYSLKNAQFLLERGIKLLVVACNTASAVALPALSAALPVPVLGVIAPGARAALKRTRGGGVGVIGTPGTIRSGAYQRELQAAEPECAGEGAGLPALRAAGGGGVDDGRGAPPGGARVPGGLRPRGRGHAGAGLHALPAAQGRDRRGGGAERGAGGLGGGHGGGGGRAAGGAAACSRPRGHTPAHGYFVTDVPERFVEVGARFLGRPIPSAEQVDLSF